MITRKACLYLLYLLPVLATGQSYQYEVFKGDKPIGIMDIKRTENGSVEEYYVKSDVTFKIIFSFTVIFSLEERFENGILKKGSGYNTLNGSYQKKTEIIHQTDDYKLTMDGIPSDIGEEKIDYTVTKIYFHEPEDGQKTYSQTFGRWLTFEKVGNHEYKLSSPDGDNYYKYHNGVCTELDVNRDYGSVRFEMKPESLARIKKN